MLKNAPENSAAQRDAAGRDKRLASRQLRFMGEKTFYAPRWAKSSAPTTLARREIARGFAAAATRLQE